jgi:hypothetical protein
MSFDGQLLDRPVAEVPVKEALLLQYFGVYVPPLPQPQLNGEPGQTSEALSYRLVRPSTVTAQLVGPDGAAHVLEAAVKHDPGTYAFSFGTFDHEGTWDWKVTATDAAGAVSTADRTFRYDTTLRAVAVPKSARGSVTVRFTLSRPASVKLQIETPGGVVLDTVPTAQLPAGAQSVTWDGRLQGGTRAYGGAYVAHLFATSSAGTSDVAAQLTFRRGK